MAEAMKQGYSQIFQKNEFAHKLSDEKLKNLVVEVTGKEPSDGTVRAITSSFLACKEFADFESDAAESEDKIKPLENEKSLVVRQSGKAQHNLQLGYTINVNLPETTNVEVYNAIFAAIRANLLTDD